MELDRFRNYLLGEGYAPSTIRKYYNLLEGVKEEHDFSLDKIEDNYKIAEFVHKLDRTRVARNNLCKAINAYMKFKGRDYRLKLKQQKGTRDRWIPTLEQKEKLLSVKFSNRYYTERNRLLIRVLFECGLRAAECASLKFSDVKKRKRKGRKQYYVMVEEGKGGKDRRVFISEGLYQDIRNFEKFYSGSEWIFGNGKGDHIHHKTVRQIVYNSAEKTGDEKLIDEMHPHAARHYRAVELLEQGINLKAVRDFLGHESLETTQRYLEGENDMVYKELSSKDKYFQKGNKSTGEKNND